MSTCTLQPPLSMGKDANLLEQILLSMEEEPLAFTGNDLTATTDESDELSCDDPLWLSDCALDELFPGDIDVSATQPATTTPSLHHSRRRTSDTNAEKKPSRPRKRKKDELLQVRAEVHALEQELERLRTTAATAQMSKMTTLMASNILSPSNIFSSCLSADDNVLSVMAVMWKQIAAHEKENATKALMENKHLRAMLDGQVQVATSLEEALKKRHKIARQELPYIQQKEINPLSLPNFSDAMIFSTLGRNLDAQLIQTDSVFEDCSLPDPSHVLTQNTVVKSDANGIFFEQSDCKTLPFSLSAIRQVLDDIPDDQSCKEDFGYGVCEIQAVCEKIIYSKAISAPGGGELNAQEHVAFRIYQQEDRVALLWEALTTKTDQNTPIRLRSIGWLTFASAEPSSKSDVSDTCIYKFCVRVIPELAMPKQEHEINTVMNLVMRASNRCFGIIHCVLLNLTKTQKRI